LLESDLSLRGAREIENRTLALNVVVAAAFGFDRKRAAQWVENHIGAETLSPCERSFLASMHGDIEHLRARVEALYALAWCLQLRDSLKFGQRCPDDLHLSFPDLKANENVDRFRASTALRQVDEILTQCDLAYCLHWCARNARLEEQRRVSAIPEYVIAERRRALDWTLNSIAWDDLTLDT
jgi:hypothetical protein